MPATLEQLEEEKAALAARYRVLTDNGKKTETPEAAKVWEQYQAVKAQKSQTSNFPREVGRGPINNEPLGDVGSVLDTAVAGWARNAMGQPVSDREVEACREYGISAASNTFAIRFPTNTPAPARNVFAPRNALGGGSGTAGGFTIRESDFVRELEAAMLYSSGILQVADIMRTADGRPLPWPTTNDSSNEGAIVGENVESTEQDVTFGRANFGAIKLTSKLVRVSSELLRDSSVNLARELGKLLGTRIGRKLNRECTTGAGGGLSAGGLVTMSTLGKTAASATAITFDELIDLMHSVDVAYRTAADNCGWMMHDTIAAHIRKLKDGDGQYIWQQSTQLGQPDRLLGWPVTLNNHLASSVATTAKTVLFGALGKYKVRLVAEIRLKRLVERYAEFDQEGFLSFQEFDGCLLDAGTHPVKYLQQA